MLKTFICYLKGYVKIRIIGYSPERFLNALSHRGIYIWNLRPREGCYELNLGIKDFKSIKPIIKKTGTRVVIQGRYGLPFFLHRYRKRKIFFAGAGICIFLIYLMSMFVWNIEIEGNISRTDETLLSFLETKDIRHGMKKSKINCPQIVKDVRKQYNDIIWVSASIKGSRLIIQVKENEDSLPEKEKKEEQAEDIVADRDCTITNMIVRKGVPIAAPGIAVKKGEMLVCGRVEVKNDAAETIGYQYQNSEATIRGQTTLSFDASCPLTYEKKEEYALTREEVYVRAGDYILTIGNLAKSKSSYMLTSKEHSVRLGRHFVLPFSYGSRKIIPYQGEEITYTDQELRSILTRKFERYCDELEKKGVEILENNVKIYKESQMAVAKGELTVVMDIGERLPTVILEVPVPEQPPEEREQINGNE